jgi:hypothetical protein
MDGSVLDFNYMGQRFVNFKIVKLRLNEIQSLFASKLDLDLCAESSNRSSRSAVHVVERKTNRLADAVA